jgi:hypothetical protein
MKVEARSSLIVIVVFILGFVAGMINQQRTDEHKWFISELKKTTSINALIDAKLLNSITDYKRGPEK